MAQIQEILVLPHTHHDIGYTDLPASAERLHVESIRRAVAMLEDPVIGRDFAWTVEVTRPLERVLGEDPALADAVARAHQRGRLAVGGGYLHMTQLVGHGGYDRLLEPVHRLRDRGFRVETVMHCDVNGIGWGAVPALNRAGIDTLVMALNPDHGRAPFEQPSLFWWVGPDDSRVLVVLNRHYALGDVWGMLDGDEPADEAVGAYLARLEARPDYPFEVAVVHAAFDNRAPAPELLRSVAAWNDRPGRVPMRIVTLDEMVEAYRRGPIETLPEYRGEWADWWAHGHGSSAREVAAARRAERHGRAAEHILALSHLAGEVTASPNELNDWYGLPFAPSSRGELVRTRQALHAELALFQEHTWGARESVRSPESDFTRAHWHATSAGAYRALGHAHDLVDSALGGLLVDVGMPPVHDRGPVDEVVVANPSSRRREELIAVPVDDGRVLARVALDPYQVDIVPVLDPSTAETRTVSPGSKVRMGRFDVTIDPAAGGVTSLVDVASGRELVDQCAAHPFAAIVDERIPADSTHPMVQDRQAFHPDHPGPEFVRDTARALGDAGSTVLVGDGWQEASWAVGLPGVLTATLHLRVVSDELQVRAVIDKVSRLDAESVFIAFPFDLAEPRFLLETTDAVFEADAEQLPDTCRDWYSIQHAVGVAGLDAGVLWGSPDAPLVQLGGFHTGQWAQTLTAERGHINSWLMNNLYFTNFLAAQGGRDEFVYRMRIVDHVDAEEVRRFGDELATPVLAKALRATVGVLSVPHFEVDSPDLEVSSVALLPDDTVRVTVAAAARVARGRIRWGGPPLQYSHDQHEWLPLDADGVALTLGAQSAASIYLRPLRTT